MTTERRAITVDDVKDAWDDFYWTHVPCLRHGTVIDLGPNGLLATYLATKHKQPVDLPPAEALFNGLKGTFLPDVLKRVDFKLAGTQVIYFNRPKAPAKPQK